MNRTILEEVKGRNLPRPRRSIGRAYLQETGAGLLSSVRVALVVLVLVGLLFAGALYVMLTEGLHSERHGLAVALEENAPAEEVERLQEIVAWGERQALLLSLGYAAASVGWFLAWLFFPRDPVRATGAALVLFLAVQGFECLIKPDTIAEWIGPRFIAFIGLTGALAAVKKYAPSRQDSVEDEA